MNSTATKLKEPVINTNHDKLSEFFQARLSPDTKCSIAGMIAPRLLKLPASFIADEVSYICNHSIFNSIFQVNGKKLK